MSEPTRCYAVVSGSHSDYAVHAIYRRREEAQARCEANNSTPPLMVDETPMPTDEIMVLADGASDDGYRNWWLEHVESNPAREETDDMRVEEFDYYENEPVPAPVVPS